MEWFRIPQQRISAYIGLLLSTYFITLGLSINANENHWLNRLDFLFYDTRFNASLSLAGQGILNSNAQSADTNSTHSNSIHSSPVKEHSELVNSSETEDHKIIILDIDEKSLACE